MIIFFRGNVRRRRQFFWIPSIPVQKKLLEWDGNWQTILCGFMVKILYICTCLREGTIFEGTIIGIGCAWGQFVQIVPSGGDNNTLCSV